MLDVLYCAPGSGLGHLNRALAICLELRELGSEARIVTNSAFAEGVAGVARFPVTRIATGRWREGVRALAAEVGARLVVADTFPRGLRGEWAAGFPGRAVYVARRLNVAAMGELVGERGLRGFVGVVRAEPLGSGHEEAVVDCGAEVVRLGGPVVLRPGTVRRRAAEDVERALDGGGVCLVVHGGPAEELERLVAEARAWMAEDAGMRELVVVSPFEGVDYYPAGNLLGRARGVVTGAGYNAMADLAGVGADRHRVVAFERRWDDQAGRLAARGWGDGDGTAEAARAIAGWAAPDAVSVTAGGARFETGGTAGATRKR